MSDLTPEAAIAEVRQYLTTPVKMFGRDLVEQLLTAHDALAALSAADRLAADAAESENDRLRGIEQHRDALWRQAEDARMHRNATLTELAAKVGEADRLREQLAAATERAETAEAEVTRLRTAVAGLVEQDDAEVKRQREMNRGLAKGNIRAMNRATKAEDERERLAERVAELEAERAALAAYRLAADTEPDDELTRVWPTVNHLPCGAGIFGYDPMDADELDLATLLRVVAEHRCATAPDAEEAEHRPGGEAL